ncbi:hypothetical protein OHT93_38660 [Streptomyces sp. NBC_00191]|uniref:hypothetical protein n=1 Tax=Streptomyces sp. NBC_00191 TaxID=2975674 RepID=UPI00325599EE
MAIDSSHAEWLCSMVAGFAPGRQPNATSIALRRELNRDSPHEPPPNQPPESAAMTSPSDRFSRRLLMTVRYVLAGVTCLAGVACSMFMLWHLWAQDGVMASASGAASSVFFTAFTAIAPSSRTDHGTAA